MEARRSDEEAEPWSQRDVAALALARKAVRKVASRDLRFRLYFLMLQTPGLSELYVRGRGRLRTRRIGPHTRIVIEGYPSSGNTYCRQAVLLANPDLPLNAICSHTHSPRVVLQATRAQLPCVVIARDPRDAATSTVQRFAGISLTSAFNYYERYYRSLLPLRGQFVVAPFDVAVKDFSAVLTQVNEKYGVHFATAASAGVSNEMVLQDIDRRTAVKHGGEIPESTISRPSSTRRRAEEYLQDITASERQAMERALAVYHAFISDGAPS